MKSNRPDLPFAALALLLLASLSAFAHNFDPTKEPDAPTSDDEAWLLSDVRQLTFDGRRSGEGYFSPDGRTLVFQSEREQGNPFYQIYALDLATGDEWRVSPGTGKTTCAWLLPGDKVLFASTHDDPEAAKKQQDELDFRASGQERRYSWDYDPQYDLYLGGLRGEGLANLTNTPGYDAEASASPDGARIVFTSNRDAYAPGLSDEDRQRLEQDPSYFADLYVINVDGSGLQRLTDAKGYDGGPFFSADGQRITWRRFSEDGATAEIYTMNADGSDAKPVTSLGAMSWAPYFHPSGDYLVFATNLQGFDNFELYIVDAAGARKPVRVTHTKGFDGLPVFSPDGQMLAWTSTRGPDKSSQIFLARWDDAEARRLLELPDAAPAQAPTAAPEAPAEGTSPDIIPADVKQHVDKLASEEFEGRLTGTEGEKLATEYAAQVFERAGLEPAGDDGTFFQNFEFTAGVSLGEENELVLVDAAGEEEFLLTEFDWRPLAFSNQGATEPKGVVFAGYGIVAPADEEAEQEVYDSYTHLDVKDKWVVLFRFLPEEVSAERRQFFNRYASLRHKTMVARDKGAVGVIVVSGPNSDAKESLVPLKFDASLAGSSIAAVSVTDPAAAELLKRAGKDLQKVQDDLDKGDPVMGFEIPGVQVRSAISIEQEKRSGRNVVARLRSDNPDNPAVVVGAHIDHLGRGVGSQSLAKGSEGDGAIHYGADDNASGTAGLLEIAEYLAARKASGDLTPKRDVLFAAWSGEELGLLGSAHFVRTLAGEGDEVDKLPALVSSYFNMDMIGRMDDKVMLHGIGSSSVWAGEVERANAPVGLPVVLQDDPYIPTDSTSFYVRGVPFVNAFTGIHDDYHKPSDTADTVNVDAAARVALLMGRLAEAAAERESPPDYKAMEEPKRQEAGPLRAYLGTVPDYSQTDGPGVKLSGVAGGGPADKAGLRTGDSIVELAGKKIENIYDYTYAIQGLRIGAPVKLKVLRGEEQLDLTITPGSRE